MVFSFDEVALFNDDNACASSSYTSQRCLILFSQLKNFTIDFVQFWQGKARQTSVESNAAVMF